MKLNDNRNELGLVNDFVEMVLMAILNNILN